MGMDHRQAHAVLPPPSQRGGDHAVATTWKISIFSGSGAFHKGVVHARAGPRPRARYAEPMENSPDRATCQDTASAEPRNILRRVVARQPIKLANVSSGTNVRLNGVFQFSLWAVQATKSIGSAHTANMSGYSACNGNLPSHGSSQKSVPSQLPMEMRVPRPI